MFLLSICLSVSSHIRISGELALHLTLARLAAVLIARMVTYRNRGEKTNEAIRKLIGSVLVSSNLNLTLETELKHKFL